MARDFNHTNMLKVARSFAATNLPESVTNIYGQVRIPPEMQVMVRLFATMQAERHRADYDRAAQFTRPDVLRKIDAAADAMARWDTIRDDPATRLFMLSLLAWDKFQGR